MSLDFPTEPRRNQPLQVAYSLSQGNSGSPIPEESPPGIPGESGFQQIERGDIYKQSGALIYCAQSRCNRTERDTVREAETQYEALRSRGEQRLREPDLQERSHWKEKLSPHP